MIQAPTPFSGKAENVGQRRDYKWRSNDRLVSVTNFFSVLPAELLKTQPIELSLRMRRKRSVVLAVAAGVTPKKKL